ncbi:MAG: S8 family peptidase [Bryobacterales bacterium]|nr:S8 family peptidase [Bryobacterales bacterium]
MKLIPLLLSFALGGLAAPKLAKDVNTKADQAQTFIVQWKNGASSAKHEKAARKGLQVKGDLSVIGAGVYSGRGRDAADLANDPDVEYITPDRTVTPTLDFASPAVGADIAFQYGFTGAGVGVAIIDSGVTNQPDLMELNKSASRIVYKKNFVAGLGANATSDQYGHGTHVAGVLAGNGLQSSGSTFFKTFRGIAPAVKLVVLRVLDANGRGTDTQVIAAIDEAIKMKSRYNIRVINLSLGRPVYESYKVDPLCKAVERAWAAGIVVVVAAGNQGRENSAGTDGYGTISSPGNDPHVITVGAMKDNGTANRGDDTIATYSSKGPTAIDHIVKPDIVAPGNRVLALNASGGVIYKTYSSAVNKIPWNYYITGGKPDLSSVYYKLSGTSIATPFVSGTVALMLQKEPGLTPETVKARLMRSASKQFPTQSSVTDGSATYTSRYDIFTIGAGYLDVWGALNSSEIATGSTVSPAAYVDERGNAYIFNPDPIVWGSNALWGTSALWGTNALWGTSAVWGTHIFAGAASALWGSNALWGTNALWGSNALWGTQQASGYSALWGTNALWGAASPVTGEAVSTLVNGEN